MAKSLNQHRNYSDSRTNAVRCLLASGPAGIPSALDILRGAAWFEALRVQTGQCSAYGVGKCVQPETYRPRADGRWPQHHNLWAKYARGVHLPGRETISAASRVAPSSERVLGAAAWTALDVTVPLADTGDSLLGRLRIGVQKAIFDPRLLEAGVYTRRNTVVRPLQMLGGQADLDGVAAMLVLLREAAERGHSAQAFDIGRALHSALLTLSTSTPLLYIASELFEFFDQVVFPLASTDEITLDLDCDEFHEQRLLLTRTFLQLEDAGYGRPERATTRMQRDILSGRFGFDLFFGLGPRWRLIRPPGDSGREARRFVESMRVARDWGLDVLRHGRRERLLPDEVVARMAAVG